MKTNFALGLTENGITLWMRNNADWLRVGAVATDAPDLDTQMQALVAKARAHTPEDFVTKLVIPDDQILYTRLEVTPEAHAIRAALDGQTPYPVEELDFDWIEDGGSVLAAVVARETLVEAEDFAKAQGLNPICFVAAPNTQEFAKEPFFRTARGVVADPAELGCGGPILREAGHVDADKALTPDVTVSADVKTTWRNDGSRTANEPSVSSETASAPDSTEKGANSGITSPGKAGRAPATSPDKKGVSQKAPPAKPVPASRQDASETAVSQTPSAGDSVSFRSRRKQANPIPAAVGATAANADPEAESTAVVRPSETLKALSNTNKLSLGRLGGAALATRLRASVSEPVARAGSGLRSATDVLGRSFTPKPKTESARSASKVTPTSAEASERPDTKVVAAASGRSGPERRKGARKRKKQNSDQNRGTKSHRGATKRPEADPEAERLTVFGARRSTAPTVQSLPRRALLISGAALMLVLAVAVWVFYFNRVPAPDSVAPVLPAETPSEIAAPDPLALEDIAATSDSDIDRALGVTDAAQEQRGLSDAQAQDGVAQPALPSEGQPPAVVSPDRDAGRVAALRSMRALAPQAPADLPDIQGAPVPYGSRDLPPLRDVVPPETEQDLTGDDTAVAEESTLPPGEAALEIVVTDGTPASVPPVRPAGIAPEPTPEPEPEADPAAASIADESALEIDISEGTPPSVPPERPVGIAPEVTPATPAPPDDTPPQDAATENRDDQASLAVPPGGVALTTLTPAARPAEIVEDAVAQAERFASATPQAVAASLRPSNRPDAFSQTVERALAAAQSEVVQTAAASVAPRIPSSASVSRAATQTSAINLRRINLLGVMGTPSARRALVRLDNGRVVTVQVGERLDGGQVTAIGDRELRYNRRGRDVVLRIAS